MSLFTIAIYQRMLITVIRVPLHFLQENTVCLCTDPTLIYVNVSVMHNLKFRHLLIYILYLLDFVIHTEYLQISIFVDIINKY